MKTLVTPMIVALLMMCGCATVPQAEIKAQADAQGYGPPPAAGWEDVVKTFMEYRLKDPDSAQYKFGQPQQGWITKPPVKGGGLDIAGWHVTIAVNARNGFGGYTGFKPYQFMLRDGRIVAWANHSSGPGYWQRIEAN